MFRLQKISQIATITPDMKVAEFERYLNAEGLTAGYCPYPGFQVTVAECLIKRIPNMFFLKYGGIEDLCVGGRVIMPRGEVLDIKKVPRAATGPDLRRVIIGANGTLGSFVEVSFKVFSIPQVQSWGLMLFEQRDDPITALKRLLGTFIRPVFAKKLSQEESTGLLRSLNLTESDCYVLAFKLAGIKSMVRAEKDAIEKIFGEAIFYWPSRGAEVEILNETILTTESYDELVANLSPMSGVIPPLALKAEERFATHFERNPC